jgi:hypothetical protein
MDIEGNIHEVSTRASDALRQSKNGDDQMSDSGIDALLGADRSVFDTTLWNTRT